MACPESLTDITIKIQDSDSADCNKETEGSSSCFLWANYLMDIAGNGGFMLGTEYRQYLGIDFTLPRAF